MEALEVEGQTDQPPLTSGGLLSTQGKLAKADGLFDDANDWFDGALAEPIDGLADGSLELVSHLHLRTRISRWRIGKSCEAVFPTAMMRITTSGDVGVNATLGTSIQSCGAKVACIQSSSPFTGRYFEKRASQETDQSAK